MWVCPKNAMLCVGMLLLIIKMDDDVPHTKKCDRHASHNVSFKKIFGKFWVERAENFLGNDHDHEPFWS